jgi:hypothetical protein
MVTLVLAGGLRGSCALAKLVRRKMKTIVVHFIVLA